MLPLPSPKSIVENGERENEVRDEHEEESEGEEEVDMQAVQPIDPEGNRGPRRTRGGKTRRCC